LIAAGWKGLGSLPAAPTWRTSWFGLPAKPVLLRLIELEGDAQSWHTFQKQHAWQGRQADQQFRRFIRSVSGRNSRYIRTIVETIDPSKLPRPVRLLLDHVGPRRVPRE